MTTLTSLPFIRKISTFSYTKIVKSLSRHIISCLTQRVISVNTVKLELGRCSQHPPHPLTNMVTADEKMVREK